MPSLLFDLHHSRGVADSTECIRHSIRDHERDASFGPQPFSEITDGCVSVAGPRHMMELGAKQPVQKRVAGRLVFGGGRSETAMIDGEMTRKPELGGSGGDLPLTVRLDDATRNERVGLLSESFVQDVVKLAKFVAAQAEPGCASLLIQMRGPSR